MHSLRIMASSSITRSQAAPGAVFPRLRPRKVCQGLAVVQAPAAGQALRGLRVLLAIPPPILSNPPILADFFALITHQAALAGPEQPLSQGFPDARILVSPGLSHAVGGAVQGGSLAVRLAGAGGPVGPVGSLWKARGVGCMWEAGGPVTRHGSLWGAKGVT